MLQAELLEGRASNALIGSAQANGGAKQSLSEAEALKVQDDSATARLRSDKAAADPKDGAEKLRDGDLDEKKKRLTGLSQGDIRIVTNNRNGDDLLESGPESPRSPS